VPRRRADTIAGDPAGDGWRPGVGAVTSLAPVTEAEQLSMGPKPRAKRAAEVSTDRPVARVAVDSGVAHLDRPFDYAVPATMAGAEPGCRVRVRFSGRLVDGVVLERRDDSDHPGALQPLQSLVSPEQVLTPEVAALARAVADRSAGSLYDVLRLALPPRHARVEAEDPEPAAPRPPAPQPASWERYPAGPAFLAGLAGGRPRAVWSALPGPTWPDEVALAVQATVAAGRGAVVVVPDARDVQRVSAALGAVPHVALRADLGPAERYRRWLAVRRGQVRAVVGTRAAAFAPVADLGLVVLWDDGDDLHAEPRSPYVHTREVLVVRAHLAGAAALLGGFARTAEAQVLVETGWARELVPTRDALRAAAPRVEGTSDDDLARDAAAKAARIPARAFDAARAALAADEPVLVQVPRRGYVPSLACVRDRTPARCTACGGPLQTTSGHAVAACRWCGRIAGDWTCPVCEGRQLRASVVGARRTAEELGRAFPGVTVRTSGRDEVLSAVPAGAQLVVATPGAEPVAEGGYGAVLLLDAWALLTRADLRAGEEAFRRWLAAAALARPHARVVIVADRALAPVQALIRWDPAGMAVRELADRAALGFPPATRMASLTGSPAAVADLLAGVHVGEVLGPVAHGDGERAFLRVPRQQGAVLAAALKAAAGVRSARKAEPVRVELDPLELV
jgi:primosomal protein N' (replication factor Y)